MSKLRKPVDEHDHLNGKPGATVTLVEYGDYQCGHCGFAHPLLKKLLKNYSSELLFVFRNFPLQESHPAAMIAAQAAEAAGLQNKFWEMHDLIYEHQEELDENNLVYFAEALDLNIERFLRDSKSQVVLSKIESDFESGIRSGVNGTPTFFINDLRLNTYDQTYESLAEAVENAE
jgi:protein-disulfide isomerase